MTLGDHIDAQLALALGAVVAPSQKRKYADCWPRPGAGVDHSAFRRWETDGSLVADMGEARTVAVRASRDL